MTNQFYMDELLTVAYADEAAPAEGAQTATGDGTVTGDAEAPASTGMSSSISTIVIMVVMVGVFYFLLIRPQRKKDKAVKDMLSTLKQGDRILTIGGIYGTITAIKNDTITISMGADKSPVVIARWAVRSVEDAPLENDQELTN
ncbi:MAG: preprotein translocase subunit YajC [Christensenellales bacterium]|jgi:preprotein translocase subunit YajC